MADDSHSDRFPSDDIADVAIERLEKRLAAIERRLPVHDHGGEPLCLGCLQPLIESANTLALSHGERHGGEGTDPASTGFQTKASAGAPSNLAPEGTRCHVIPDDQDYINTDGSTAWTLLETGGAGAPKGAKYLVEEANADLTAETVVGVTPQGELGGTWPSTTVDATHSGTPHHKTYTDPEARTAVPDVATITFGWEPQSAQVFATGG